MTYNKINVINHLLQQLDKQLFILIETEKFTLKLEKTFKKFGQDLVRRFQAPIFVALEKRKKEVFITSRQINQLANEI